ncbi:MULTISPECIES: hypothetical protein [unclassified Burkholderia]|uniref:hypothetical protein n=1 Tax=unclassified Burkholderia TaxID=2613784 RepID=UPI0007543238|nr:MULTISPECIES: hypothetical protein [unclassified Burkholderia]KUY56315.1 hypothetical protein WS45_17510 [Burkholderia sp. RF2-non_BP3]KUY70950.1 hypothetical protein WS46_31120 [Burkholderia sp. RF4-BP95]KUZ03838.1 hypothetical protein WS48_32625 [Burkholderia sp. RF7-non_BP1]KUZ05041.1 hypothetical protein WS49_07080 [Burkholderia sp. RF7-non_BP4]
MNPRAPFEHLLGLDRFAWLLDGIVSHEACENSAMGMPVTQQFAVFDVAAQQILKFLTVHDLSPGHGTAIRASEGMASFA